MLILLTILLLVYIIKNERKVERLIRYKTLIFMEISSSYVMCSFAASTLNIYIRSEGFSDPRKNSGAGSRAYIIVNGKDHSSNFFRGHNVVIVDAKTGVDQITNFQ